MNENVKPKTSKPSRIPWSQPSGECRFCVKAREMGALFCPSCGQTLMPCGDSPTPSVVQRASASTPPVPSMMESPDVETFPQSPLAAPPTSPMSTQEGQNKTYSVPEPDTILCKTCEWELPSGAKFCPGCAAPIGTQSTIHIRYHRPDGAQVSLPLAGDSFVIGKADDCHLVLRDDGYVSRRHARLRRENNLLFLEDLGSSNGTLLRIRRPIIVETGDEIVVGSTVICVE